MVIHQGWLVTVRYDATVEWRPSDRLIFKILFAIRLKPPSPTTTARNPQNNHMWRHASEDWLDWGARWRLWESVGPSSSRRGGKNINFMEKGVTTFSGIKRLYSSDPVYFLMKRRCVQIVCLCWTRVDCGAPPGPLLWIILTSASHKQRRTPIGYSQWINTTSGH